MLIRIFSIFDARLSWTGSIASEGLHAVCTDEERRLVEALFAWCGSASMDLRAAIFLLKLELLCSDSPLAPPDFMPPPAADARMDSRKGKRIPSSCNFLGISGWRQHRGATGGRNTEEGDENAELVGDKMAERDRNLKIKVYFAVPRRAAHV